MPFPEVKRVVYKKNPLDKVICQLRFPPVLRIDSEVPSTFQDIIRNEYPLYNEKMELRQDIAAGIKPSISPDIIQGLMKKSANKNHEFSSEDSIWRINLTRTFLSISTSKYTRWEDFIARFKIPFDALLKAYDPPFFTRLGLRYVDIIDRAKLGINDSDWKELLKPYFLGLIASPVWQDVKSCECAYEISLADNISSVRIAASFVQNVKTGEKCYMVDSDFYTPKRQAVVKAFEKLDFLHQRATRLIQWIITEKLHNAMEPEEI